jgi:fructose-bisphosphate aldolase class I
MDTSALDSTARTLVAPSKGLLAADESQPTIKKRFDALGIPDSEEMRRSYREMLFTAPRLGDFISGVILFDETIRQKARDGRTLVAVLQEQGIIPGIKVDAGAKALAGFPGEKITEGLDGLRKRLAEYAGLGARFTKWRAVITIGPTLPTENCLIANAQALARYAALSQEAGLVPLVEPEILMDGDHPLERHFEVTAAMQRHVFQALAEHRVRLEGMLLKSNMTLPGTTNPKAASVDEVAKNTLRCLQQNVPAAVPGVVFLSGGQEDVPATAHLNVLNQLSGAAWQLSFSYGRALQAPSLKLWAGKSQNVAAAQQALLLRAKCNSAARDGKYSAELEQTKV